MSQGGALKKYLTSIPAPFPLFTVDLSGSDEELEELGAVSGTGLSVDELKTIRDHFRSGGRMPTDVELQSLGQAWSEHCCYKSSKVFLKEHLLPVGAERIIDRGDAGVMEFDDEHVYALRIESHNHPSAVEPYGGAATGIGGILRDVLCMGAQPVALVDPLFFGPLDHPREKLPKGVKHPTYLLGGVVSGIRDYGNRVGIPTVSGGLFFHGLYLGNCLVNVGCVGVAPKSRLYKNRVGGVGDNYILVGGRTGRDGIHGVTFASAELDERSEEESRGAVQLGDPITKEPLIHAVLEVAERNLITGMKDLGGGGLSCVVGEMALSAGYGAQVDLSRVHLKEEGMAPWEIWISESQERMMLSVREENVAAVLEVMDLYDIEARIIGKVIPEKRVKVDFGGVRILDLDLEFLTGGPEYCRPYTVRKRDVSADTDVKEPEDFSAALLSILSHYDICDREWIIRQYDHEVRGNTVLRPLHGKLGSSSHGDAAVIAPVEGSDRALAIAVGANPRMCLADPYRGGMAVMAESIQNVVSVGARPDSFSNCLNFGNPEKPDRLGDFYEVVKGMGEVAGVMGLPTPSGNVSFYNETPAGAIPPTPVVMTVGIVDQHRCVTSDFKGSGNSIILFGNRNGGMGGSVYLDVSGGTDRVPGLDPPAFKKTVDSLLSLMGRGAILSCHDVSQGGLAVTLSEMAFGGGVGFRVNIPATAESFFGEGPGAFVLEVEPARVDEVLAAGSAVEIGRTSGDRLVFDTAVDISLERAVNAWKAPLWEALG